LSPSDYNKSDRGQRSASEIHGRHRVVNDHHGHYYDSVPTTSTAVTSGPSTSKTAVTSSKSPTSGRRPISSTASEDFPTRKPCQPEKPYNAAQKIKMQVPEPEPVPRQPEAVSRPPEVTPATQRHLKIIDHKKLANATLDYNISTDEISRGFALKYALREGD